MAETYGPFNSGSGASFDETKWRELWGNAFTAGILKGAKINNSPGADLAAGASGGSMQVYVGTGCGFVYGFAYENDATIYKTIETADPSNIRYDRLVLRMSLTARTVKVEVVKGTAGSGEPALTQTSTVWEVPIARVQVDPGVTQIAAGKVTDQRDYVTMLPAPENQGAGSSLNADTVDGSHAAAFVLSKSVSGGGIVIVNYTPDNNTGENGDLIWQW